jgi:hypothetical protein
MAAAPPIDFGLEEWIDNENLLESSPLISDSLTELRARHPPNISRLKMDNGVATTENWFYLGASASSLSNTPLKQFHKTVDNFVTRGGSVVAAPSEASLKSGAATFTFALHPEDVLLPVCHEGMNRSQIMHLVARAYVDRVVLPHGAESGYDPYCGRKHLNHDNMYQYVHGIMLSRGAPGEWLHDAFYQTFGVEKRRRPGQYHALYNRLQLNPADDGLLTANEFKALETDRTMQWAYMNNTYFNPVQLRNLRTGPRGRVVFITFCRAFQIVLKRLLKATACSFENVVVVALPFGDCISRAGGKSELDDIETATGTRPTRMEVSAQRHAEVYAFYNSLFTLTNG